MIQRGFWKKAHYLNKMSFSELVVAYFQHYTIQVYLIGSALLLFWAFSQGGDPIRFILSAGLVVLVYPLAWYLLHRFVLHGQWLFKSRFTAKLWKRIHFDHHQNPHHLEVLFGALYTTLPTIAIISIPIGFVLGGPAVAAVAFATGMLTTCFYEFCHCVQHLSYKPRNRFLAGMKSRHMEHHFFDEKGNFGITNFFWDYLFSTYYVREECSERSVTVFNLGYTYEVAERYPWVLELTGGVILENPRQSTK